MGKYEFQSRIRYSECGEDCRLNLGGAVNYFQDAATFQGEELGIGIPYLRAHNMAWILASWQIFTGRMPRLGENVRIRTWAYEFRRFYGFRNLELVDEKGERAVWANSVWVLMDTKERRPVQVPDLLIERYGLEEKLEMDYEQRRIIVPEEGKMMEPFSIHRGHLDSNHHVNNRQYIQMALDYLPDGFELYETRVEYRQQTFLGDVIRPFVSDQGDVVTVSLLKEGEEEKACANIRFSSRNSSKDREGSSI
jgi:acyl-ACP thioesterase